MASPLLRGAAGARAAARRRVARGVAVVCVPLAVGTAVVSGWAALQEGLTSGAGVGSTGAARAAAARAQAAGALGLVEPRDSLAPLPLVPLLKTQAEKKREEAERDRERAKEDARKSAEAEAAKREEEEEDKAKAAAAERAAAEAKAEAEAKLEAEAKATAEAKAEQEAEAMAKATQQPQLPDKSGGTTAVASEQPPHSRHYASHGRRPEISTVVTLFNHDSCSAHGFGGPDQSEANAEWIGSRYLYVNHSHDLCDTWFHGAPLDDIAKALAAAAEEGEEGRPPIPSGSPRCGEEDSEALPRGLTAQWCAYGNVVAASIPPYTMIRLTNACIKSKDYSRDAGFIQRWGDAIEVANRDNYERCFLLPQPTGRAWGSIDVVKLKSPAETCAIYTAAMERALNPPGGDAALSEEERAVKARMPPLTPDLLPGRGQQLALLRQQGATADAAETVIGNEALAADASGGRRNLLAAQLFPTLGPRGAARRLAEMAGAGECKARALVEGDDVSTSTVHEMNVFSKTYLPAKVAFLDLVEKVCPQTDRASWHPDRTTAKECDVPGQFSREVATAFASGMYAGCGSYCLFSATEPWQKGWTWEPSRHCWEKVTPHPPKMGQEPNECFFKYKAEVEAAVARVSETGCHDPEAVARLKEAEVQIKSELASEGVVAPVCRADEPDAVPDLDAAAQVKDCLAYWDEEWTPPADSMGKAMIEQALGVPSEARDSPRYVYFDNDLGGFNNIRMAFEWVTAFAAITGRILVLPPPAGWYLINFGNIKVGAGGLGGVSHYSQFFDVTFLNETLSKYGSEAINFTEFVRREGEALGLPDMVRQNGGADWTEPKTGPESKHRRVMRDWAMENFYPGTWSPFDSMLCVPDCKPEWEASQAPHGGGYGAARLRVPDAPNDHTRDGRPLGSYVLANHSQKVIYFPDKAGDKKKGTRTYRQFGQVATAFWFRHEAGTVENHRLLRSIHYTDLVFEAASRVVAFMGLFNYSSMHIRRNDLQYQSAFLSAKGSVQNTAALLRPNETLYIASDELEAGFFQAFHHRYCVYRLKDFFGPRGGNALTGLHIPDNLLGPIEQVIMASGRVFIGTHLSTFSSFVNRLRGYIGTPDTNTWYHNGQELAYVKQNMVGGNEWTREEPSLWEQL